MNEKILVTGGTGFVGSFVVEALLRKGYRVTALVRDIHHLKWLDGVEEVEYIEGDLNHIPDLPEGITRVVHLAGVTKESSRDAFMEGNVQTTSSLLARLRNSGLKPERFLFISSQAACGPSLGSSPRVEDDISSPLTWYGESKLLAEQLVREAEEWCPVTIIRPPTVYGPRDRDVYQVFRMLKLGLNVKNLYPAIHTIGYIEGITDNGGICNLVKEPGR